MNELLKCPRCNDDMIYDERQEFWRCPLCGGEWWEDVDKLAERIKITARVVQGEFFFLPHTETTVLPPVAVVIAGKGGRKSGRKRKKPVKQARPWQVF